MSKLPGVSLICKGLHSRGGYGGNRKPGRWKMAETNIIHQVKTSKEEHNWYEQVQ